MCLRRRDGSFHPAYTRARATATQPHPLTGLQRPAASPTLCSATYPEGLQACVARPQAGFQRVQVNATAANGADVTLFADAPGAAACVEALQQATYLHFEPQP